MRIEVDQRAGRKDTDLGSHARAIDTLRQRQHRRGRGLALQGRRQRSCQFLGNLDTQRVGERETPGRDFLDIVPFDVDRPATGARGPGEPLRQQRIDPRHRARIHQPSQVVARAGLLTGIGIADRLKHPPFAALTGFARQPNRWAGADNIGGADISIERRAG